MNLIEILGELELWGETGTEGISWAIYETGKKGYDGLNFIEPGDKLEVYNSNEKIYWKGKIQRDFSTRYLDIRGINVYVGWTQKDCNPEFWADMFRRGMNARLKKCSRSEKFEAMNDEEAPIDLINKLVL